MSATSPIKMTIASQHLEHGHFVVGAAAARLSSRKFNFKQGVILAASLDNTKNIWIGKQGLTADNTAGTGGFPLTPGSSMEIPVEEFINIFAISEAASQDLAWIGV